MTNLYGLKCLLWGCAPQFVRNIYGDEIIQRGYRRSIWRCTRCGTVQERNHLHQPS